MSRKMAFTGIFTSIAVVFLYLSTIMPTGKLTLYFLASLPVAITIVELGAGAGITVYFAASLLNILITGNITGVVPFVFFFGHYPVFKYFIEKGRKAAVELLLKLTVFNMSILLWYLLFKSLFITVLPAQFAGRSILTAAFITALQAVFLVYDYVFSRLLFYYQSKLSLFRR
jgi:riboflavin transporter FmnP